MNKYSRGKIYKIVDNTNGNIYIGSTIQILKERLRKHKNKQTCSSRLIINNGDYDIVLIENYPCESKKELEMRERYYILNNQCINVTIPGRTQSEYYHDNKEKIYTKQRLYVENHKEFIKEYQKDWNKKNREYQETWGGRTDLKNNSLLKIDPNLFQ